MRYCTVLFLISFLAVSCATTSGKIKYYNIYGRDCNVCHRMDDDLDALDVKYKDSVEVMRLSDTSDTGEDLIKQYRVSRYPLNIFYGKDGKVFFRYDGILDKKAIEDILDRKLKNAKVPGTEK
jgi:thiol-disulfide isomerase/thioredoxin